MGCRSIAIGSRLLCAKIAEKLFLFANSKKASHLVEKLSYLQIGKPRQIGKSDPFWSVTSPAALDTQTRCCLRRREGGGEADLCGVCGRRSRRQNRPARRLFDADGAAAETGGVEVRASLPARSPPSPLPPPPSRRPPPYPACSRTSPRPRGLRWSGRWRSDPRHIISQDK